MFLTMPVCVPMFMQVGSAQNNMPITVSVHAIEQIQQCTYLGSIISIDGILYLFSRYL